MPPRGFARFRPVRRPEANPRAPKSSVPKARDPTASVVSHTSPSTSQHGRNQPTTASTSLRAKPSRVRMSVGAGKGEKNITYTVVHPSPEEQAPIPSASSPPGSALCDVLPDTNNIIPDTFEGAFEADESKRARRDDGKSERVRFLFYSS